MLSPWTQMGQAYKTMACGEVDPLVSCCTRFRARAGELFSSS